jgi:hypothetical protein
LRSKIAKRDDDDDDLDCDGVDAGDPDCDDDSVEDRCDCACSPCQADDCANCSNADCDSDDCEDCPFGDDNDGDSDGERSIAGKLKTRKRSRSHRGASDALKPKFKPITAEQQQAYRDLLLRRL